MHEREEDETPYNNKFYWCFFELNNGEIIDLHFTENLTNGIGIAQLIMILEVLEIRIKKWRN